MANTSSHDRTTPYRLGELTKLATEFGFECDRQDEVRVAVRLAPDAVLEFCNLEAGDSLVGFEGTPWHSHGIVQFMTGVDTYVEYDELDIVLGLGSGELVVVSQYLKGQLQDRRLAHKHEPLDLRHLEPDEELRVLRLRTGGVL